MGVPCQRLEGSVYYLFLMIVSNHCYANNSFWISFSSEQFILRAVSTQRAIEKGAHVKLMFTRWSIGWKLNFRIQDTMSRDSHMTLKEQRY